ncbi:hypothetical protein SLS62_002814 [Diatrype stigma]|uniref:Uncharacterized protein n=1 Tax=Diatrype stigma TaxID=117547 RepID=A0AAN9UXU7_9PEZI
MDVSALDLAAVCADLVGTAGTSAVLINRLLRRYSDAPNELRRLQAQAASAKLSLDQILSFLDSDPPAIQRQDDLIALDLYFSAIRAVVNDAQRRVSRLESNATGQPGCSWSTVQSMWDSSEISASEERLMKQVKAIGVYISIARLDEKSQHLTKLRHKRDLDAARDDAFTYIDAGVTTGFDSPPPYELRIPNEAGSTSDGTTYHTSTQPSAGSASDSRDHSVGSARSPEASAGPSLPLRRNAFSPARRPLSQLDSLDDQSGSSLALVSSRPQTAVNNPLGPYLNSVAQRNGARPSESTPSLANTTSPTDTSKASEDLPRTNPDGRPKSGLFSRKNKSMVLLGKDKEAPLFDNGVQGDVLYPEEFRARVGSYTTGLTPAWRSITLVGNTTKKTRYRNRFTDDPADDIVKSDFKIGDKKMWDAIIHKESEKVEEIMQHRWSKNIVVEKQDGLTAMHMAASLGLCSIVHVLTKAGANPNSVDRFGLTPLHYAADFGCANCLQVLVGAGAKVSGVPPKANIKPPIWYAAARSHVEATTALLRLGAQFLNQITAIKETLLHVAVKSGSVPICQSLFEAGANPNESFSTLLMASSRSPDLLGCLRKAGADINMRDSNQETLLHKYVAYGDVPMVCYLLALGADPNLADVAGRTPLHTALLYGDLEAAATLTRALVKKGADPNAQDARGQTPLHLAVLWGRADAVLVLCQAGADQHVADEADTTPWAEAQKPDYTGRAATATTPAATATGFSSPLADFKKSRHIMGQWHGKPVRRKPTLTAELTAAAAAADAHSGSFASPPLPSPGHPPPHHQAVGQAQELEACEPLHFAAELPA